MQHSHFLENFYTWQCAVCVLAGFVGRLVYTKQRAKWLDRHRPNKDGSAHVPETFNRLWVGIMAGLIMFGYLLLTAQRSEDHAIAAQRATEAQEARLKVCVVEFQRALKVRSDMAAKDAELSNGISDLRNGMDEALAAFLKQRLNPPANISSLPENDPRRLQWREDITTAFAHWQGRIREKIDAKVEDRKKLAKDRADNPLPEFTC